MSFGMFSSIILWVLIVLWTTYFYLRVSRLKNGRGGNKILAKGQVTEIGKVAKFREKRQSFILKDDF